MNPETLASALASFYPLALGTHVGLVIASVSLFVARGIGVLARQAWPMRAEWRRASVLIDVGLLGAGIALWTLLRLNPWHDTWLGAKLVLLVAYIVLGSFALKRAPTRGAKLLLFAAALLCVGFMAAIAWHHSPLGWWA
jgi:uncharacterized membrane protein SirB2